jgi:hypothetical protein
MSPSGVERAVAMALSAVVLADDLELEDSAEIELIEPPKAEESSSTSSVLESEDVVDLLWVFRDGGIGGREHVGGGSWSVFAAMLDRAALFSFGSRPCTRCGGRKGTKTRSERGGTGFVPVDGSDYRAALKAFRKRETRRLKITVYPTDAAARVAREHGLEAISRREMRLYWPDLPPMLCRECPACEGRGWLVRTSRRNARKAITARPMGSSMDPQFGGAPNITLDEDAVKREGRVLRRLRAMDPELAEVMRVYYSAQRGMGDQALWPMVPAGKTLLRRNHLGLSPDQFFSNEREALREKPDPQKQALFDTASEQARELHARACRAWNEVAP